jgi:hypothetical protein
MSKKCAPLWREAHFQVNMSEHFWKLLWRKAHFEVKMHKTHHVRTTFVEMSKKCTPLWREARFEVKMHKARHARTTFGS